MIAKLPIPILIILLIQAFGLYSQENDPKDYASSTLFNSSKPLKLEIYLDKKQLLKDTGDDRKYHPALIKYQSQENQVQEIKIKIQTRGNFRRNPSHCNMAPLRFKISKDVSQSDNIFSGQKKLKLVIPCRQENEKYQEYIILEYLIYRSYELFSEFGYKTRLVSITMIDSIKPEKLLEFTGFFIEETDQLAQRNNGIVKDLKKYHPEQINRLQMTFVNVFQYLIANTDWSVQVGHNIKLLFVDNQPVPYAIPYDFDWSGIISPPYAVPAPQLGINNVGDRIFRGYKREIEEYDSIIRLFNDKKEALYNLFLNCELLSEKTKTNTIKYIDEFYETINNPKLVKKEFIDNCRKP
jgi:hypothetical protein